MMDNICIVTITGPSASGKSVLEGELVKAGNYYKVVSTTTRQPRDGEVEGVDYKFVSHEEFVFMDQSGLFVERVFFKGNGYAVDVSEITKSDEAGRNVVIVCEPHGAKQIRTYCTDRNIPLLQVFVTNKLSVLVDRFVKRQSPAGMSDEAVKSYVERLEGIIYEHAQWPDAEGWDMAFDRFNEENQHEVVKAIMAHVEKRLGAQRKIA